MGTGYISLHSTTRTHRVLMALAAVIAISFSSETATALTSPLMNDRQEDSTDLSAFTKWTSIMPRYESQQATASEQCIGKGCQNQKWEALLSDLSGKSLETQIERVNTFFNKMTYVPDQKNYGTADYWQTPYEMMEKGGDCEDYAIAKYISLKRLGVSESDMRILIVRDRKLGGIIHAVLEVQTDNGAKILDNQAKTVKTAESVLHYAPVYAINESKWWAYK